MPNTIRAGELRHRVAIQTKVVARDGFGGESISRWEDDFYAWAEINTPKHKGSEYFSQVQTQGARQTSVRIRYQKAVSIEQRVKIIKSGRTMSISSVINPNERDRELILICVEEVT